MLKKLVIAAAAVVVGLVIVKKTDLGSLLHVWWKDAGGWCSRQVPLETRVKQLKLEIGKIDDDIKSAINQSVRIEVEHDKLKADVAGLKAKQEQRAQEMKDLKETLRLTSSPAQKDSNTLSSLTRQYNTGKAELANREKRLADLAEQIELADEQITKLKNKKDELLARASKQESDLVRACALRNWTRA